MKKEILKRLLAKPGEEHSVSEFDARYTGDLTKSEAEALLAENIGKLSSLQDKLYAQDRYAVLVIFQAMDAAGKDGTIKHVMSGINPQGCQVYSFKQPSAEELDHDYLWRINRCLPERGRIGIFNRSHYEDVLVAKCILKLFYPLSYRVLWDREILLRNFGKSVIVRLMITNAT